MRRPRRNAASGSADDGLSLPELLVAMTLLAVVTSAVLAMTVGGLRVMRSANSRVDDAQQARLALDEVGKLFRTAVDPDGDGPLLAFQAAGPLDVTFYANVGTDARWCTTASPYPWNSTSPSPSPSTSPSLRRCPTASPSPSAMPTVLGDPAPVKVRLWVDTATDTLQETVWQPSGARGTATWPGAGSTRTLATRLVDPPPRRVFGYLKATDTATNPDGTTVSTLTFTGDALADDSRRRVGAVEIWLTVAGNADLRTTPTTLVSRVTVLNRGPS
jgi:prepilin-type N-terminal cleavage/methylation domain-containing protein